MAFQSCFLHRQVQSKKSINAEGDYRLTLIQKKLKKKMEIITFFKHAINWSLQE
jgi:hypothetical protein